MSARKRPAAAALAAPPKKRLRGKQEAPSYNASLPDKFLAWRAQHIYTAYKNLGGEQLMESLADDLALTEPNPAHYAEHMALTLSDLRLHLARFPNTTMVTCTKKKAARLNELVLQLKHPRKAPWTVLPGDVEVNPDNYEAGKLREDRAPKPSEVPIYKGIQLYLTKNIRKKDDYVNGMLCHVEAWSATSGTLRVRTKTNKRLYITPWTDVERSNVVYYPIRLGYASTVQKVLGDEVERITAWLDTPNLPAVAYTALSRVEKSSAYSLAGKLTPAHFTPAVEK